MSKTTIVQDVLDVFRAAGFEVRVSKFGDKPETIIYGTADNAGILMESVCENFGISTEAAFSCAQRENKDGTAPLTAPAPLTDEWPTAADIFADNLDNIAEQWAGCIYQAPADDIDIGESLRREFAKLDRSATKAAPAAPVQTSLEFTAELDILLGRWASAIETGFTSHEAIREKIVSFIREAAPVQADQAPAEPIVFDDYPEFNAQAMGCGLEDCDITDRYHAMRYGFEEALDLVDERIKNFLAGIAVPTQAEQAAAVRAAEWISVEDRLPESPESHHCLAAYRNRAGRLRIIRAMYARQFEVEATGDECDSEYNEADDREYLKAGWLERIDNWGEYSSVYVSEGPVTHWMPLPAAPSTATSNDTAIQNNEGEQV